MAYTANVNVIADLYTVWAIGKPIILTAGDTPTLTVTFLGATSVSTPTVAVYQGSKDVSATVMPAGSNSASGNVVTCKPLTALVGNKVYVVAVGTAEYPIKIVKLRVQKASSRQ